MLVGNGGEMSTWGSISALESEDKIKYLVGWQCGGQGVELEG